MAIEALRAALRSQPFRAFDLCLADGRSLPVAHPEFVGMSPQGRTISVWLNDGSFEIVDLLLVASLRPRPAVTASPSSESNGGPAAE